MAMLSTTKAELSTENDGGGRGRTTNKDQMQQQAYAKVKQCITILEGAPPEPCGAAPEALNTLLLHAVEQGDLDNTEYLLQQGANHKLTTDKEGDTLLHIIARHGHTQLLPLFLSEEEPEIIFFNDEDESDEEVLLGMETNRGGDDEKDEHASRRDNDAIGF